jgi:hypothetical protein
MINSVGSRSMNRPARARSGLALFFLAQCLSASVALAATQTRSAAPAAYTDDEVAQEANEFFKTGAESLGKVLAKVLKEKGHPIAIVRGEEAGGALAVGVRYGHGELIYKGASGIKVFWQGPSVGLDLGADAVKVFALIYALPNAKALFQRFPSAEGSLYFVGGFGVNYLQRGAIVIAPVRFGVGWRQGIDLGYIDFTPEPHLNPF